MIVLGIYDGHDASCALIGPFGARHFEKERFTRRKHDVGDVDALIDLMLAQAGVKPEQVNAVAYCSPTGRRVRPPWEGHINQVDGWPGEFRGRAMPHYLVPHHTAHAAYARWAWPSPGAVGEAVLTLDGGGDALSTRPDWIVDCAYGAGQHGWQAIDLTVPSEATRSIGHRWNDLGAKLFNDPSGFAAGKIMALAGVSEGVARAAVGQDNVRAIHELQDATVRQFHELLNRLHLKGAHDVRLAGGCALNGPAVREVMRRADVASVYVPPACNDGGLSLGAALHVTTVLGQSCRAPAPEGRVFIGYDDPSLEERPEDVGPIVDALVAGQIVCVAQGRAESGPRALGHRSILADPRYAAMRDRINAIKGREPWRPVAPSVMAPLAPMYFDLGDPSAYHYMTVIAHVWGTVIEHAPAAMHDDHTARPQLVWPGSLLADILEGFYAATGVPILLNTSLNCAGEAIANDSSQVHDTFRRLGADMLVCGKELHVHV